MARGKLQLWQLILAGPFLIWMGIHEYGRLADVEETGGKIYVDKLTHFLYTIGGKNLVLVGTCGFGIFYVWALIRWIKQEKIRRAIDEPLEHDMPVAPPKPAPRAAPREALPRLSDDPFRAPPAPAPIVAVATQRPIETPIVASAAPDDGPKLLR
jgi:hypothetical protein